jgi:TonB family protein
MLFRVAACGLTFGTVAAVSLPAYPAGQNPGAGQAIATFVPARLVNGSLPLTPSPLVVARIEEILEVVVDTTGRVGQMTPLRASPLPADPLTPAVAGWAFQPTLDRGVVVPSRVLVAAIFRPAQLNDSPTFGEPPVDLRAPSDEIPYPIVTETPPYPPLAVGEGVVLVEVLVGVDGRVQQLRTVAGSGSFGQAALNAAGRWLFRPARRNDRAVEAYAYLLFGFRTPVVVGPPARPGVPAPSAR